MTKTLEYDYEDDINHCRYCTIIGGKIVRDLIIYDGCYFIAIDGLGILYSDLGLDTPRLNTGDSGGIYSPALCIPDFLKWGDVSLIAALGHAPVRFQDMRSFEGRPLTDEETQSLEKEIRAVRKKLVGNTSPGKGKTK